MKPWVILILAMVLGDCGSAEYYRMRFFETFCMDCGKPALGCHAEYRKRPFSPADRLEAPVGSATGDRYYIAQGFGEPNKNFRGRKHLGEDWNFVGGGDSDYGAPVYSIGNGVVTQVASLGGGWGKVVRVCHRLTKTMSGRLKFEYMESIYAHLYRTNVKEGERVLAGQWIGAIGNGDGVYTAHLHLELRAYPGQILGGGYANDIPWYYLPPSKFIQYFRKPEGLDTNLD